MPQNSTSAGGAVRRAKNSRAVRGLARGGYAASGVLHLLIGWLAVQLALGESEGQADQSGAFRAVAQMPGGELVLWLVAVGFTALAVWQLATAVVGVPNADNQAAARGKSVAKAVLYGVLAVSGVRYATGGGGGSSGGEESLTARVLAMPGGAWLVGAAGLVIVGVGVYHVVKGVRKKFLEDLTGAGGSAVRPVVVRLGQIGYAAKGIALGVVGGLVVAAAVTADPEQAGGLDEALHTMRDQPYGTALLIVIGLGIAAYGGYSFARARFARL
ncbi:DUF1206 domain-containing protein [Promicromonospora sukumoe]|uniref:DUF1206 domain-containing protein n=1 Tax=Promicromonospora sukumoe TaxID=88382 RepID=A0A7W3PGF9_9MICO|nr:DUF1206 domain-containing protein [Promicromonospora sukumoe]MBA8810657.1 hypothetical protein [Promicromonospora sukumoe]